MLHVQQLINAAIATEEGLQITRIELGTSHTENRHSTTELLRKVTAVDPMVNFKAYSMQSSTE